MENITILCDTREKTKTAKILGFRALGYPVKVEGMRSCDYSYSLDSESHEYRFLIERKSGKNYGGGGWSELLSNWAGQGKGARIKQEFKRIEDVRNVFLIIENATPTSWHDVKQQTYKQGDNFRAYFKTSFDDFMEVTNNRRVINGHKPIQIIFINSKDFEAKVIELVKEDLIDKETSLN